MLCHFKAIECVKLSNPLNGLVIMEGIAFGSIATYSCEEGFNVNGQARRICESDGNWSDRAPTCISEFNTVQ